MLTGPGGPGLQIGASKMADPRMSTGKAGETSRQGNRPSLMLKTENMHSNSNSSSVSPSSSKLPSSSSSSSSSSVMPRLSSLKLSSDTFKSFVDRFGTNPSAEETNCSDLDLSSTSIPENGNLSSKAQASPVDPENTTPRSSDASQPLQGIRKHMLSATSLNLKNKIKLGTISRQRSEPKMKAPCLGNEQDQADTPLSNPVNSGASLLDDISVECCKLSDEFVSASMIPGKRGREIGRGATAIVNIMYKKDSPKRVAYAVKEFRKDAYESKEEYARKVKSEFSIANSLNHPNIVQTVRICTDSGLLNHVMEYCSYGELFSLVKKDYLQLDDKLCLFKQLIQGVWYLHSQGIAHRDIKLENLLLSENSHLKITDFGVAEVFSGLHPGLRAANEEYDKELDEVRRCAPGICGSLPYIAPEVLEKNGDYDPRALDVWSCGIVCLALLFCGTPWGAADLKDPKYARFMGGWEEFFRKKPDGIVEGHEYPLCGPAFRGVPHLSLLRVLLQMLHPDPYKRVTIDTVLYTPYVKRIVCCCSNRKIRHRHGPPAKKGLFKRH
ncbi:hypothetical protein AWENTII_003596 [Aspergillus wentii]